MSAGTSLFPSATLRFPSLCTATTYTLLRFTLELCHTCDDTIHTKELSDDAS